MKCLPEAQLGPQLVVVFRKVLEPFEGGAWREEAREGVQGLTPLPVPSLRLFCQGKVNNCFMPLLPCLPHHGGMLSLQNPGSQPLGGVQMTLSQGSPKTIRKH